MNKKKFSDGIIMLIQRLQNGKLQKNDSLNERRRVNKILYEILIFKKTINYKTIYFQ